jgi:hypothetical protein
MELQGIQLLRFLSNLSVEIHSTQPGGSQGHSADPRNAISGKGCTPTTERFPLAGEPVTYPDSVPPVCARPGGAAELLGINRSTLWSRMRKLGIETPKSRGTGTGKG